ncbi:MAG TPA: AraC family transcriptional regulator [Blastocatellia bacterium]|nr:AraC family transcriptional regulator [Blastocatellia bacterium]
MSTQLPPGSYYGVTLRSRKVANFELSERIYSPGYQTPKHTHKQALFCFVMQGNYTETYGSRTRECESSTLLYHPPGELHAEHFHEAGGRSFIIEMAPGWLEQIRCDLNIADSSNGFRGGVFELLARKLYREFDHSDNAAPLIIEGLMMEMLGETIRHSDLKDHHRSPRWLEQAKELLHARFTENLTLTHIAQSVGVHPVHLAQTFHKTYHCTVGDYLRKLRIEYACRELATSTKPIVDIALAAGFCDQSHFTRTFKRAVGTAPSQYRESLREA